MSDKKILIQKSPEKSQNIDEIKEHINKSRKVVNLKSGISSNNSENNKYMDLDHIISNIDKFSVNQMKDAIKSLALKLKNIS